MELPLPSVGTEWWDPDLDPGPSFPLRICVTSLHLCKFTSLRVERRDEDSNGGRRHEVLGRSIYVRSAENKPHHERWALAAERLISPENPYV